MPDIKLGSLFDGIGVFPLAASRCGIRPVWASEIEKAPISITKRHFPEMAHLGDITKIDGGKIELVHVLTFGSPCQNLSLIGNRSGLAGAKSSLFYQAFRRRTAMHEKDNYLKTAELSTEQNQNMIDGVPNNTPLPPEPPELDKKPLDKVKEPKERRKGRELER